MSLLADIGVQILLVTVVALSLDVIVGDEGLVSVLQAGLVGVGAYGFALASGAGGGSWVVGYFVAGGLGALVAMISGFLTARLRGDYFVLVTLGLQVLLLEAFLGWRSVTGGALGYTGIRQLEIGGMDLGEPWWFFLVLPVPLVTVAALVVYGVRRSPLGIVLHGTREGEDLVDATGRSILWLRFQSFLVSGALAGLAGGGLAQYYGYIEPRMFDVDQSVFFLVVIILGGVASIRGAFAGAALIVLLGETLRLFPISNSQVGFGRGMIYGLLLVVILRWRSTGLFGRFDIWDAKR